MAGEKKYSISVLLQLIDKFTQPIGKVNAKLQDMAGRYEKIGSTMSKFVTLPIVGLGVAAIKTRADIEKYDASFTTMLKSGDAAKKFTKDLRDFAAKTPLEFGDLARNAELMLAFNIQSKDVLPTLQMLGDVARGDSEKLNQLSLAYSQMSATGRLMGQDLLQMINAGFNPLTVISEKTGKSMAQLKDEMSKGMISVDMVTDAFKSATSAGGLFYRAMETQSKTFYGRLSTLKDNFTIFLSKLGDVMFPTINKMLDGLAGIVEWLSNLGEGTKTLIVLFGGLAAATGPVLFGFGKLVALFAGGITPVHLVIGGLAILATTMMAVSEAIDKHNKRFTITADNAKKEADQVNDLVSEYEMLKKKTNLNTQEKLRLITVENQLKTILPETALVFDEQAKLIGINTEAVKQHISELKRIEKVNLGDEVKRLDKLIGDSEKKISASRTRQKLTAQEYSKDKLSRVDIATMGLEAALADQEIRKKIAMGKIDEELKKLIEEQLKLIDQRAETQERLNELENKGNKKQNDDLKKQNELLKKNLGFKEKLALLQTAFSRSGGFAVERTRGIGESIAAMNASRSANGKAEVTIKVKADQGTTATIDNVNKNGDIGLNIISDSYLGHTVLAGSN
jgi:tape measure domain-containing protein